MFIATCTCMYTLYWSTGLDLSGGDLSSVGNSVVASDGLISYYPQLSGFGEFRNGEESSTSLG